MAARTYYPRCAVKISALLEDFSGGASQEFVTFEVVPRRCDVHRNDHRTADQVRIELDYRDFPLDPRTLRSVLVVVAMADLGDPGAEFDTSLPEHQSFIGYIDEPQSILSGDGELVRMEGRDYTGILLDHTWRDGAIDISRSLSAVIAEILAAVPGAEELTVSFRASAQDVDLSKRVGRTLWTPRANDDVWTILVDMCRRAALIPVIVFDTLEIRSATDFGAQQAAFVYGENLSRLTFKRDLNSARSMQVRVVAWNEATRTSTEATYPTTPIVVRKRVLQSGQIVTDTAPVITYAVAGLFTAFEVEGLAQAVYEEAAREQVEGELETHDLTDLTGLQALPQLANGDALVVELGKTDELSSIRGMSESEAVAYLTAWPRSMDPAVADALVSSWTRAQQLATTFYVKEAMHSWSRDEGYRLRVKFINYILGS